MKYAGGRAGAQWKDKTGKVVAKTVNGKLVWIHGKQEESKQPTKSHEPSEEEILAKDKESQERAMKAELEDEKKTRGQEAIAKLKKMALDKYNESDEKAEDVKKALETYITHVTSANINDEKYHGNTMYNKAISKAFSEGAYGLTRSKNPHFDHESEIAYEQGKNFDHWMKQKPKNNKKTIPGEIQDLLDFTKLSTMIGIKEVLNGEKYVHFYFSAKNKIGATSCIVRKYSDGSFGMFFYKGKGVKFQQLSKYSDDKLNSTQLLKRFKEVTGLDTTIGEPESKKK